MLQLIRKLPINQHKKSCATIMNFFGWKMTQNRLDFALDLMRRLPPQKCEGFLGCLIELVPDMCGELLSNVDQPLKVATDSTCGKQFLLSDYNRDGDSYRSPWSNQYFPPFEDGSVPIDRLRKIEIDANHAIEQYKDMYFDSGVSSVYAWDLEHSFACAILIKKDGDAKKMANGSWDSIHIIEVQEKSSGRSAHYKLTSTIMLWLLTESSGRPKIDLSGSLTRQSESDAPLIDSYSHVINMGKMIEEMENKMRGSLNTIYFGKTYDIISCLRSMETKQERDEQAQLQQELARAIHCRQDSFKKE
ncbi:F-actin-capping protein subunit beta [Trichinella murrelli]|uniref:F-actin-capping protein subunit beta n=2 Tax=Trichinella TaxID=6333 RepID=A0A0V0TZP2_9BILA|nr:F-actin-capping protein subunit beta [Trichinella murrelli]